jgi:hypothetical protein
VVGIGGKDVLAALGSHANPSLQIVDLVGLPRDALKCARYEGACW